MCWFLVGYYVAERIKELCVKKNMSQYELAKRAGMTQSSISTLLNEGNVPKITTLEKVCKGFGITLAQFLQWMNNFQICRKNNERFSIHGKSYLQKKRQP